jgi:acetolactate synthase-1/2/3 large subunit
MIKVSDYIVKRLAEHGITQAFSVVGGGSMHLNDSFGRSKDISVLYNHHEQACAMAAEGYARATGKPAAVVVTSGPGGTNCLTGVIGQWLDSVPCIYLSGQVKREYMASDGLRQLGDQEINIIDIMRPVTKCAMTVVHPNQIKWLVDMAIHRAIQGRPGPVWLDIPLDVQSAMVEESVLLEFIKAKVSTEYAVHVPHIPQIIDLLESSSRPVFLAGHGIRIAGAQKEFLQFVETMGLPVVTTIGGMDLIPSDHPLFVGRAGTIGTYAGNYAIQNADLLLSVGTRNNIRQIGFEPGAFARDAKKIVVDIDAAELNKPTFKPDIAIHADAGEFLKAVGSIQHVVDRESWKKWLETCKAQSTTYCMQSTDLVDPYHFIETLTDLLPDDAVVVSGNGTASVALYQAAKVKAGQRMFMNSGCAAMGYDLPAVIGACCAALKTQNSKPKTVICITGDGSIQMNIQELATIAHHNLPIKIFVFNNNGYKSIRMTQDNYFDGRHVGADYESGISCPDISKIAKAYGLTEWKIYSTNCLKEKIQIALHYPHPIICDVRLAHDYTFNKIDISALSACSAVK